MCARTSGTHWDAYSFETKVPVGGHGQKWANMGKSQRSKGRFTLGKWVKGMLAWKVRGCAVEKASGCFLVVSRREEEFRKQLAKVQARSLAIGSAG